MWAGKNRWVGSRRVHPLFLLLRTCDVSVVLVFVGLFSVCVCYQEQKFAMEPQDQTAVVGSRVTLPCRVENKAGQLQWTKDDFGLGLQRDLGGYERYRMIGSDEEGDYSLDIRDVTLEDDAKYQCQVSSGDRGEPAIRSRYAKLNVLVPPEPPRILQGNYHFVAEDKEVVLECVAVGGKPPAEITWVDDNAGVLTQNVNYTVEPLADGQRFTARSVIKLHPKKQNRNQTFSCQAQNTADRAYRSASIIIEVKYAPRVKIVITNKNIKIKRIPEGIDATFNCNANANPPVLSYKWYLNDKQIVSNNGTELIIRNVTRDYNEMVLKCVVFNEIGKSEESETLDVSYAPSFRALPNDAEGELDSQVTLTCDVDGHPPPEIIWLHEEEDQNIRVGKTANLSLQVDSHTVGKYLCKASVEGYPEIEASAHVLVKGPPKILSNRTQYGSEGDTIRIECAAFAVPKIESIIWTFDDKEIDTIHDQDYTFQEDIQPGGIVNSSLVVRESQSVHFGVYRCNISNEYGSDSLDITVKPLKTFPLLLILFGATSVTIMLATLCLLLVLCQRKQRRNKLAQVAKKPDVTVTAEELFKEGDRNSNISDLKLELRQVNGNCEIDYSNTGSDSTLCSNAKLGGLPLAGAVPLPSLSKHQRTTSTEYHAPYADLYKINGYGVGYQTFGHFGHDYTPGSLRVQSPPLLGEKLLPNRSINGSLPRSVDSASTVQFNPGSGSQNNSLKRPIGQKGLDSSNELSSLASSTDVNRLVNGIPRVDIRYAATYGNPHLRSGTSLGFAQVNTAKPASTPAPPPYSSVRSSVVLTSGTSSHSITSRTSLSSPPCAASPLTTSVSADSSTPQNGTTTTAPPSPCGPSAHYVVAPSNRTTSNTTTVVTKKGTLQSPLATHV